jgi:hypothetical protein
MGYDRKRSPLDTPGSTGKVLGQGGLVDAAGGFMEDLSSGNFLGAIKTAGTAYNTFKNKDLKTAVKSELKSMAIDAIRNNPQDNRNTSVSIPKAGASPGPAGTAGSPTIGGVTAPTAVGKTPTAGQQVNGAISNAVVKFTNTAVSKPLRSISKAIGGG